jgi:lysophospholipase L1-like esterase
MNRQILVILAGALLLPVLAPGQLVEQYAPPRANCCLPATAKSLADQLQDWNQLGRYYADNQRLLQLPPEAGRVVFLGDSITDGWKLGQSFPGKPYVNRGISGQTTPQMLIRFRPDVIALQPKLVVILAGTNDLAGNTGAMTIESIEDNLVAMADLAKANSIKVVFASLLPVSDYEQRDGKPIIQTARRPPEKIKALNEWMKTYAANNKLIYLDYYSAMIDEKGFLRDELSDDGLHPNTKGYEIMAPLAESAIARALKGK